MIGEAFTAAYREFLKLNGIREEDIEETEFHHVLNAQSASCIELDSFVDDTKMKQVKNVNILLLNLGDASSIISGVV